MGVKHRWRASEQGVMRGIFVMYGRESGRLEETEEQRADDLYLLGNIVRVIK
jgi:hypothetical protein